MGDEEHVILREQFPVYPGKTKFDVSVTSTKIITGGLDRSGRDKNEDIIMMDDVIGCHVLQDKKNTVTAAYLCIFSYPLKKKRIGSGVFRQRVTKTFTIDSRKTYQENLVVAETWKMTIKRLVTGEKIRTKEDIENGSLATRNLLVLINPFSGKKKATTLYKEKVKPMFREAEIKHTVQKTDHPGHAKEIAKQLKLKDWDGIIIISGDGLVHEVINGLMDRPDWKEAIKMPIGIVPGGSGNALAAAIVYASTGLHEVASCPVMCTFEICRGRVVNLDLVAIETKEMNSFANQALVEHTDLQSRNITYSFMNIVLGIIADIDIESECLRCLGGDLRNIIYAIIRIISLRKYHLEISYLPCANSTLEAPKCNGASGDAPQVSKKDFLCLSSLDQPVPPEWVTEEDEYVLVMANYLSHISYDLLCQKRSKLEDGKIFLNMNGSSTTRRDCMKSWDVMEGGEGFVNEKEPRKSIGKTVECTAFRITPRGQSQIITTDGEVLPFGPIQCEILPGLARVMTSKK